MRGAVLATIPRMSRGARSSLFWPHVVEERRTCLERDLGKRAVLEGGGVVPHAAQLAAAG